MNVATPEQEWITRAEAGRRLAISRMAVTKLCHRGMPHRMSDGNVPWPETLYWCDFYRAPRRSGSWHARHPGYSYADERMENAARELRRPMAVAWWRLKRARLSKMLELRHARLAV
jgi:hypothetical protein